MTPLQLIARMQAHPNVWHIVGHGWSFMVMPRLGPYVCVWGTHKAFMIKVGYLPRLLEYINSL
jgi:mannitol-specific phosphotransferase system IIBC component